MDYSEFLDNKKIIDAPTGLTEIPELNPMLFDFQKDIVRWALRRGRAAIFADCGMGKTPMQLEWAKNVPGDVLIMAPLAVSSQTIREAEKFHDEPVIYSNDGTKKARITITNYEQMEKFNPGDFNAIVLDECFPFDTMIDCVGVDDLPTRKYIKDIRRGDKIYNAYGVDYVYEIHKRQIKRAVRIDTRRGCFTSSENHPFFTMHGWKCAQDLQPNDYIMETTTAMRMVREDIFGKLPSFQNAKILQSILFSELENEPAGNNCKGAYRGSPRKNREKEVRMVQEWISKSDEGNRTNQELESISRSEGSGKDIIEVANDEVETFRAWGQWTRDDITAAENEGCTVRELDTGICYITGPKKARISNELQSRLRKSRIENSDRSRWIQPRVEEGIGSEKGCYAGFIRVDSVEIYEQGDSRLDKYREESGIVYFYDIKATRHPSFSINGCLVHNSSILKAYTGKYRTELVEKFGNVPFRLACTATPAPNDFMELGNHAEFLGAMTRTEMLSMFFVHDGGETQTWRLKGHAESEFWKWVCSWAVMIRKPSDLGYGDGNFILPPLNMNQITVHSEEPTDGMLFAVEAQTLQERQMARRSTIDDRVKACADIVNATDDICLVWCDLNSESEALHKAINNSVEVKGSDSSEYKENELLNFAQGKTKCLISKASIAGFGLNFQVCHKVFFVGLSDSYEAFYQAIRRCWRFGQNSQVECYIIAADTEGAVVKNIQRKEEDASRMAEMMVANMHEINEANIKGTIRNKTEYNAKCEMALPDWLTTNNRRV